jgi:hypothetical protein
MTAGRGGEKLYEQNQSLNVSYAIDYGMYQSHGRKGRGKGTRQRLKSLKQDVKTLLLGQ